MKIKIRSFAMIRESLGSKDISIEIETGARVVDVIHLIANKFSQSRFHLFDNDKINSNLVIILNDEKIDARNYSSVTLAENDNLVILPPAGGG